MQIAVDIVRTTMVLWLCLGTQIHVALEHGAYWHHVSEHTHAAEDHDHDDHDSSANASAGVLETQLIPRGHHHHEHEMPHGHELDAVTVVSKVRPVYIPVVAILPIAALQETYRAEANSVYAEWYPPPILHLSQETAPRAPPLA